MGGRPIHFTNHALEKFDLLRAHGLDLDQAMVSDIVRRPNRMADGYGGRSVAQGPLDDERVLRVVYEETSEGILVVTFCPGKRSRYE